MYVRDFRDCIGREEISKSFQENSKVEKIPIPERKMGQSICVYDKFTNLLL